MGASSRRMLSSTEFRVVLVKMIGGHKCAVMTASDSELGIEHHLHITAASNK